MTQSPAPLTPEELKAMHKHAKRIDSPDRFRLLATISDRDSTISTLQAELENLRAKPTPDHVEVDSELTTLLKASVEQVKNMSPAEREAMFSEQRASWVRGETGMDETTAASATPPQAAPGDVPDARKIAKNWLFEQFGSSVVWQAICPQDFDDLAALILRERTAARSEERERGWLPMDQYKDGVVLAGLWVTNNRLNLTVWEVHKVYLDDDTGEAKDEYDDIAPWRWEDFEAFAILPDPVRASMGTAERGNG